MACTAVCSPCSVARVISARSSSGDWLGAPWPDPSAYGCSHHAVRVLSEPSLMIFSGPIVNRS